MKALVFILLTLALGPLCAQAPEKSIRFNEEVTFASVDRPGDFYFVQKDGQIHKIDQDGKLIAVYRGQGVPDVFEPRDGARLFAYYREKQQYDYLNPSFHVVASYHVDPAFAIEPWLICTSGDHKLWLLDKADNSLKKLNAPHTEIEIEVVIDSAVIGDASEFSRIRDYQGFVFALHPDKGIFIFNGFGRYLRTIEVPGLRNFNFLGGELYYLHDNQIHFFDLFTTDIRVLPTPAPDHASDVLLTDERMVIVRQRSVEIHPFRPY